MGKHQIESTYDAAIKRYRASVIFHGEVVYTAVRAKREAAVHVAQQWIAYNT